MANSTLALGSSLNLRRINKSVSSLGESVRRARLSSASISKSLLESNRNKRQSLSLASSLFRRRREATLRREREDILEAGSIVGAVRRTGKVVMNSTKGFLGRILDYVGTVLVGWAIVNLPKIIKLVRDVTKRMQKYFGILQNFVGGVSNFLLQLPSRFGEIFTSISTFGFDNYKKLFEDGFGKLKTAFQRIQNQVNNFVMTFMRMDTASDLLNYLNMSIEDFSIPGLDEFLSSLGVEDEKESSSNQTGSAGSSNQTGSAGPYPDPKSAEMYRIAAALTTEGNSDQGYADMMQVLANRKAMGYAGGGSYTDILTAGSGGIDVAFAGVWDQPGGPRGLRNIRTLSDAAKWAGMSEDAILEVISLMTDPARQSSASSFVKGAVEFRASPQNVKGNPLIEADAEGFIAGSVWRGTALDNQFIISNPPGSTPVPIRSQGAAPLNLPPKNQNQKVSFNPATKPNVARANTFLASAQEMPTNLLVLNTTKTKIVERKSSPQQQRGISMPTTVVNSTLGQRQLTFLT